MSTIKRVLYELGKVGVCFYICRYVFRVLKVLHRFRVPKVIKYMFLCLNSLFQVPIDVAGVEILCKACHEVFCQKEYRKRGYIFYL